MLFGLASGASLATVVGVLIEVPTMLFLVYICKNTKIWFPKEKAMVYNNGDAPSQFGRGHSTVCPD